MPAIDPRAVLRLLVHVDDTKFRTTVDPRATVHRLLVKIESEYAALMAGREPVVCLRLKDADGCLLPGTLTVGDVLAPDAAVVVVHDGGACTSHIAAHWAGHPRVMAPLGPGTPFHGLTRLPTPLSPRPPRSRHLHRGQGRRGTGVERGPHPSPVVGVAGVRSQRNRGRRG